MSAKVFKLYDKNNNEDNEEGNYYRVFSLKDFFDPDVAILFAGKPFYRLRENIALTAVDVETTTFFEIDLQKLKANNEEFFCLKIVDVSISVRVDLLTIKQHALQTINATVSHEMRNPINSIHC
jgi:signal transduction histidine kinase